MTKILGIPGKWLPTSNLIAGVILADHRYGAEASLSISNDTYSSYQAVLWAEMLAFKNNLKLTTFINSDPAYFNPNIKRIEDSGKMWHDLYFMTDKWVNPITGNYEVIPDYYSTTWTNAGASVFANAVSGQPKPTGQDGSGTNIIASRYPSHGQQMYDISGGEFGYNFPTNTTGASNLSELRNMDNFQRAGLEELLKRKVSTYSYRNGITTQKWLLKDRFLGARNSSGRLSGPALTSYGFKQSDGSKLGEFFYTDAQILVNPDLGWTENHHLNRQNAIQYESSLASGGAGTDNYQTAHNNFKTYLTSLINGGSGIKNLFTSCGWFQEFTHFGNMYQGTGWQGAKGDIRALYADYLATVESLLSGHFVNRSGYGEIVEYHTLRDSVKRIDLYQLSSTKIRIAVRADRRNELINTPVTVILDLSGTSFAGKNFKPIGGCKGIRKISSNVFAVDVLYSGIIEVDTVGVYHDFQKPTVTASIVGDNVEWSSDKPVGVVLYSVDSNGFVSELFRSSESLLSGKIPKGSATVLKLGAVNKTGESVLVDV